MGRIVNIPVPGLKLSAAGNQSVDQGELIERSRKGDRHAQRLLFEQSSGPLYRLLHRLTGNRDEAFDLTQETYLKAFAALKTFDGRSSFKTWLFRIGVNEALQVQRRSRLLKTKLADLAKETTQECEPVTATTCRIDVNEALLGLEPIDRAILLLRYHEGLDYRQISEAAGIPPGTVASRLNRARERLRFLLKGGYGREERATPVHLIKLQEHTIANLQPGRGTHGV